MANFETTLYLTAREVLNSLQPVINGFSVNNQKCSWNKYISLRYQFWGSSSAEVSIYIPRYVVFCLASTLLGGVEVVRFDPWVSTLLAETWTVIIRQALDKVGLGQVILSGPIFSEENPHFSREPQTASEMQDLVKDIVIEVRDLSLSAANND